MDRQMFRKGGAAFPDLSGDGKVTQKDILIGRGVIEKQEGGMVPEMMPSDMEMMMAQEEMQPMSPEMQPTAPEMDPNVLQGLLQNADTQLKGIDDSEDYEEMINAMRGDQQPIEARRAELGQFVGPEDAQATPESVLTLVQPVMQMASVDQGIGGLAQGMMGDINVEGPMAEGIMSTINMEEAPAPAMPMEAGQSPVNFRQGGAVQYFAPENDNRVAGGLTLPSDITNLQMQSMLTFPAPAPDLKEEFEKRQTLLQEYFPAPDRSAQIQEDKDLVKAQMLFDAAQGFLNFADTGRFAQSFAPVLGNIGARAGEFGKIKRTQQEADRKEKQALDLEAFRGAEQAIEEAKKTQLTLQQKMLPTYKVIGGDIVAIQGNNAETIYSAEDDPVIKVVDNEIVSIDPKTGDAKSIFSAIGDVDEKPMVAIINGVETYFDASTPAGIQLIERVNKMNADAGQTVASVNKIGTGERRTAKAFNIFDANGKGRMVLSYDGGKTFLENGNIVNLQALSAQKGVSVAPVSDMVAADHLQNQKLMALASQQLGNLDILVNPLNVKTFEGSPEDFKQGETEVKPISPEQRNMINDALTAAYNGTGGYAYIASKLDKSFGQFAPETLGFPEIEKNKIYLESIKLMGRSALVANPRNPVVQTEQVSELFPNTDEFFRNPITEGNKLVMMKEFTIMQLRQNLQDIASGAILDAPTKSKVLANNNELHRLLKLLGGVDINQKNKEQNEVQEQVIKLLQDDMVNFND
jgi:hypothetical protein